MGFNIMDYFFLAYKVWPIEWYSICRISPFFKPRILWKMSQTFFTGLRSRFPLLGGVLVKNGLSCWGQKKKIEEIIAAIHIILKCSCSEHSKILIILFNKNGISFWNTSYSHMKHTVHWLYFTFSDSKLNTIRKLNGPSCNLEKKSIMEFFNDFYSLTEVLLCSHQNGQIKDRKIKNRHSWTVFFFSNYMMSHSH